LDNQLWLHFRKKAKYVFEDHSCRSQNMFKEIVKLCLKSVPNALYIRKSAADKIATTEQVNNIKILEYSLFKNWFFLTNSHL